LGLQKLPILQGPSWWWSYGSCIYNYLCNQCLPPLTLWVRISFSRGVLDTILCDKVCQWLATGRWFSPSTPVSSTNKTAWPPRYNWNIVESGVKHHNHQPNRYYTRVCSCLFKVFFNQNSFLWCNTYSQC
jgi:hypothetical protein